MNRVWASVASYIMFDGIEKLVCEVGIKYVHKERPEIYRNK